MVIKKKIVFLRKIIIMRFIIVIIILFAGFSAYSQSNTSDVPIILQENDISLDDDDFETVSSDSITNPLSFEIFDSTLHLVPAAELYGYLWNNQLVNPYKHRLVDMPDTVQIDFSQYCHPNNNVVTSDFGFRRGWQMHYGIDTRLKIGDTIRSSFDGMVRIVTRGRAYGNYIVIRHYNGLETVYAHLSKNLVQVNQIVSAGEVIGLGGNTGRSTGPHLHYEIRYLGQPISPRNLIDFENYTAKNPMVELHAGYFAYVKEVEQIRYYTVRKGDTLSGIARKTGVSVAQICRLNNIKTTTTLRIGQRLRIT